MKKIIKILLLITMILMIQGCAEESSDFEKANESVSQFMRNTYEIHNHTTLATLILDDVGRFIDEGVDFLINDYERRIKPYATQNAINELHDSKFFLNVVTSATRRGFDINVANVLLDHFELDNDKIFTDYEITLILTFENGTKEEIIKNGKLQLIRIDDVWKINHEKSNSQPIVMRATRR